MLAAIRISSEMRKVPQKAVKMIINRPKSVPGKKSPYPTVVILIMMHHIEIKMLLKSS